MARTLLKYTPGTSGPTRTRGEDDGVAGSGVFFRALVDLGTGGVAGIETARERAGRRDAASFFPEGLAQGLASSASEALGAWGREVREPAAYLVRGDLTTRPERIGAPLGVAAGRIILMFDVAVLFREPGKSLDLLIACKRAGARILLDNFDLDDPPARFMEMLPADILRVAPRRMPWHWDDARRQEVMASVLGYAGNLLMDVAVEGVDGGGQRREFQRLGVRYAQGRWRRDTLGLIPDPIRL